MNDRFRAFLLAEKASHERALERVANELAALGVELPPSMPAAILVLLAQRPGWFEIREVLDALNEAGRSATYGAVSQALSRFVKAGAVERAATARGLYRLVEREADPAPEDREEPE